MYTAYVSHWNGACYEACEQIDLSAEDLSIAIDEASEKVSGKNDIDYDVRVEIIDSRGDTVHIFHMENSVARNSQNSMDETWEDQGEYTTEYLGLLDGEWYTWRANGGSHGAHDRMDGSGRWIERYEMPVSIDAKAALTWLVTHGGRGADEALEAMAEADSQHTLGDILRDVGECLWRDGDYIGVYRVRELIYTVYIDECEIVDADDAVAFARGYDEDGSLLRGRWCWPRNMR